MVIRVVDVEGGLPLDVMRVVKIIMVVGVVREANVQYLIYICQSLLVIKHNNAANIITSRCKVSGQD